MKKSSSIDQQKWWKRARDHQYIRGFLFFMIGIILYVLLLGNVLPEKLDVQLSQIAEQDIRSPITIEHKTATEERRSAAVDEVSPVYELKREYAQNQVRKVHDIFDLVIQVRTEAEAEQEAILESEETAEEALDEEEMLSRQVEFVKEVLSPKTSNDLSDETLITFLQATDSQLQIARETTTNAVHEIMSVRISIRDLSEAKEEVKSQIAISTVSQNLLEAMKETAEFAIIPNYIYDANATEQLRQETAENVEPVLIREGQLLVKEGELISHDIYEQLRMVGLLDDSFNVFPYIGLALLVGLIISMLSYYVNEAKTSVQKNNSHLLMFSLIFVSTVVLMKITSLLEGLEIQGIGFVVPVSIGAMLITLLIHTRLALFTGIMFAVIGSIMFNNETVGTFHFSYGFYMLFSSFAGAYFLSKSNRISRILRAGLFVSFVNMVAVLALLFLKTVQTGWFEIGMHIGFAFLSGFVAAVLTIGLLPFFEAGFGILSTSRLIELSSPNHPLLRKILVEAPGTYHHSVVVGNLSEAACESIGENGLLARVGSYYHDLGKTKRPHFFIENQMKMENPHDKISPQLSRTIIIAHPYDGADLLREYKMPKEIIDIAEQHHGTTLLKFFYHKANQESEKDIPESQFRYPGPKAQTKVSAIVGIADSVEAAVRTIQKPTPDKIEALVRKIIQDKLEDGQFDESDLTLKELDKVAVSICETLKGTFHQRIEYPEDVKGKGDKKDERNG
ncbi:HD family phosphohydrolase [Halalkalibacter akibai]|uniref:Membrane protein n=1 Tax=Halalkalibacter akibai (strain ATCC 43226 / DSM 21942 / CIP 109018 / JCM 9157 / 1139) TaxID=1236973 RepID=W4QP10_HALA3|nr:HD family phosphohydrolase [Halalkalibacter akibai]GAE33398.1 membrane protein [Halalkalibacter akibai JCM 9157]